MTREHIIQIVERDDPQSGKQYRVICSCGWITPWYNYRATAEAEAQDHV